MMRQAVVTSLCALSIAACGGERKSADSTAAAATTRVAQAGVPAQATPDSVRRFVQSFYDWYVPLAEDVGDGPVPSDKYDSVFIARKNVIAPELLAALREDVERQRRDTIEDEIVSATAEHDPFLWWQDPCPKYRAQAVERTVGDWIVTVRADCGDSSSGAPVVLVRVGPTLTGLEITNVKNAADPESDLLSDLERAREAAKRSPALPDTTAPKPAPPDTVSAT